MPSEIPQPVYRPGGIPGMLGRHLPNGNAEVIRLADKVRAIRKDLKHPFNSRSDDAAHKEAVREMDALYGRMFPEGGED
jgi:hypothetical protein